MTSRDPTKLDLEESAKILNKHCSGANLRRFDEDEQVLEASFMVDYRRFDQPGETESRARVAIEVSLLDCRGVI